ncbi:MAG TPA: DGQHR domain-containing protein [Candidatus Binatus sp.]|jgi:DGQHR domain-containing protein|nr:DGQHR domain-containing protein [Candidatus Binatus sp.]
MITVPAIRLHQFGVFLYQALLGARDVDRLVRFEVLSYGAAHDGGSPAAKRKERKARVNWELLEKRIAASAEAYQRPVIRKKIADLVEYYGQCADTGNLPAIPGAVLLVADRRLEFTPTSSHRVLGVLQIPAEEGVLRALDGQHRLLALHQLIVAGQADDVQVPAVVFDRLSPDQVVELFVTINAKHTKLNPSHLISLAGRRLYPDKELAASHDIIRTLNENADSPLHGDIKLFGVGHGRVAQAPLAEELKGIFTALDALGGRQSERFRESAQRFFLNYFKQIARVFPRAWVGRKYSIKTATALRAFLRVVPDVLKTIRASHDDPLDAHAIGRTIQPWATLVGDSRFETEGEWRQKQAGGTRGTVELLARELRGALGS